MYVGLWFTYVHATKMCIKYAPYFHQKCANGALDMVGFLCFGADVRIALNLSQISPF